MKKKNKKEAKKKKGMKKIFKIFAAILIILIGLTIIVLLMVPKEVIKSGTDIGALGNIHPFGGDDETGGDRTSNEIPSEIGGEGGSGGGTETSSEEVVSSPGILEIINRIDAPYTNHGVRIGHWEGASEDINDYDHIYGAMFNPSNVASKIISNVSETELDVDSRPLDSSTTFYFELSLVSQSGNPITISSSNELRLSLPLEEYEFEDKTLTIQRYDPEGIENYKSYDVKSLISKGRGTGKVILSDLDGQYNSEEPYAYFRITIS